MKRIYISSGRHAIKDLQDLVIRIPGVREEDCHVYREGLTPPLLSVPDLPGTRGFKDGFVARSPVVNRAYPIGKTFAYREPGLPTVILGKIEGVYQVTKEGAILTPGPEHYDYLRYYVVGCRVRLGIRGVES